MKSSSSSEKGMTLTELLVALLIFAVAIVVAFPVYDLLNRSTTSQLNEYHQRSDVLIASEYITSDIHHAKSMAAASTESLEVIGADDIPVYYRLENTGGKFCLTREKAGDKQTFSEITGTQFILESPDLVSIRFNTENAQNSFKASKWGNELVMRPDAAFFEDNRVTIFTDQLLFAGDTSVAGRYETIYVNSGISSDNDIELAVNLYVNGDILLAGDSQIGFENKKNTFVINGDLVLSGEGEINGDIYVAGDLILSGDIRVLANVYVQGNVKLGGLTKILTKVEYEGNLVVTNPSISTSRCFKKAEVPTVDFPEYRMPPLRPVDWYQSRGYNSGLSLVSNSKVYVDGDYNVNITSALSNVIIVSTGDITINNMDPRINMSGVLFAPNGTITLNGQYFTGVIISKTADFVPVGIYTPKSINDYIPYPADYPFGGE